MVCAWRNVIIFRPPHHCIVVIEIVAIVMWVIERDGHVHHDVVQQQMYVHVVLHVDPAAAYDGAYDDVVVEVAVNDDVVQMSVSCRVCASSVPSSDDLYKYGTLVKYHWILQDIDEQSVSYRQSSVHPSS